MQASEQVVRENYNALGLKLIERMYSNDYLSIGGIASTDRLIRQANIGPGSRVLDVGSGLGGPAMRIAEAAGCQVTGLDLLALNVKQAVQRSEARGLTGRVQFVEGDATQMPFEDDQFNVIIGQDAWCHIPDRSALFGECARTLVPGGLCTFTDWVVAEDVPTTERAEMLAAAASPQMGSTEEYLILLPQHGFEVLQVDDISATFVSQYRQIMAELERSREALVEQTSERVMDIVFAKNNTILRAFERGWMGGLSVAARQVG